MKRFLFLTAVILAAGCSRNEIRKEPHGAYTLVYQSKGPTLGYSPSSGVAILTVDGFAFKDLNRSGALDPYEDWRLPVDERSRDLAGRLSLEEICGLMLYSSAQHVQDSALTPSQRSLLEEDHIRHMLIADVKDARTAALWSNAVQALCEAAPLGIPSNNSSDPRNYTNGTANVNNYRPEPDGEFNPSSESDISKWPREVGMAATFDVDLMRRHGEIVSAEYRAMGITTALSPQADISTDPRWRRFYGTFSEDPALCRDLAQAYCDAFQTTPGSPDGWGNQSVNCMVKHWPGGGTGEGGRDAHFGIGKYLISCCAADSSFGGFMAKINDLSKIKDNTWYEMEGVLELGRDTYNQKILVINVVNYKKINGDNEELYMYPCYAYGDGSCSEVVKYNLS